MKHWLETNPFWFTLIVFSGVYLFFGVGGGSLEMVAWLALFTGVGGFANSLWLNKRINRIEDVLYQKHIAVLGDFAVPKKPSHLDE